MLRPELLVRLNVRLSSDAFSGRLLYYRHCLFMFFPLTQKQYYEGWQSMDPNWQELNDDVIKATRALFDEIIPQYTESLKKRLLGEKRAFFVRRRMVHGRIRNDFYCPI